MQGPQMRSPTRDPQPIADLLSTIMVLCQGKNDDGKPVWAYVCVRPSMAKAFHDARQSGGFNLADYSTIIESGEGETVPAHVQNMMERDYGARHDYEQLLLNAIEQIKTSHF